MTARRHDNLDERSAAARLLEWALIVALLALVGYSLFAVGMEAIR